MNLLDHTFGSPEENLACDEVLLDLAEEQSAGECLRLWVSMTHFVVLGSSNRADREVNVDECRRDHIPILRRRSGGGAVLQGPGCLSYCLILPVAGVYSSIAATNRTVLNKHKEMLDPLLRGQVSVAGLSDLVLAGMKFSGNSQRRRLRYLMIHGTFLLDFDLEKIDRYLRFPSRQPAYRRSRGHLDFLTNLHVDIGPVRRALVSGWSAGPENTTVPAARVEELVRCRYGLSEWNLRL